MNKSLEALGLFLVDGSESEQSKLSLLRLKDILFKYIIL